MDLDVKIKAVMVGAVFLIVSHVLLELNDYQGINYFIPVLGFHVL